MRDYVTLTAAEREAVRLAGEYTGGRYEFWWLSGPAKASCRAHVLSALRGARVPQSKAGVNALRDAMYALSGAAGACEAERAAAFAAWAKAAPKG